jgi:hypothetical protein
MPPAMKMKNCTASVATTARIPPRLAITMANDKSSAMAGQSESSGQIVRSANTSGMAVT